MHQGASSHTCINMPIRSSLSISDVPGGGKERRKSQPILRMPPAKRLTSTFRYVSSAPQSRISSKKKIPYTFPLTRPLIPLSPVLYGTRARTGSPRFLPISPKNVKSCFSTKKVELMFGKLRRKTYICDNRRDNSRDISSRRCIINHTTRLYRHRPP